MIQRVTELAESPSEFLTRGAPPEFPGKYAFTYRSEAAEGLTLTLVVDGFDADPPRLVLVAIVQTAVGPDDPGQ